MPRHFSNNTIWHTCQNPDCGYGWWGRSQNPTACPSCNCRKPTRASRGSKPVREYHGSVDSHLYKAWTSMNQRCSNPKNPRWKRYGGRGITVCADWRHSFRRFLSDVGPTWEAGKTLDRINNNGNYEHGNWRWATRKQQQTNMHNTVRIEYCGVCKTLAEWAAIIEVKEKTLYCRIKRNWPVSQALGFEFRPPANTGKRRKQNAATL